MNGEKKRGMNPHEHKGLVSQDTLSQKVMR